MSSGHTVSPENYHSFPISLGVLTLFSKAQDNNPGNGDYELKPWSPDKSLAPISGYCPAFETNYSFCLLFKKQMAFGCSLCQLHSLRQMKTEHAVFSDDSPHDHQSRNLTCVQYLSTCIAPSRISSFLSSTESL